MRAVLAVATLAACTPPSDECNPRGLDLRDAGVPLVIEKLAPSDTTFHVKAEDLVEQATTSTDWALEAVEGGWAFTDRNCGLGVCTVFADIPPQCPDSWYRITFTLADLPPLVLEGDSSLDEEVCFWGDENCRYVQIWAAYNL